MSSLWMWTGPWSLLLMNMGYGKNGGIALPRLGSSRLWLAFCLCSLVLLVCSDKTSYHIASCPLGNNREELRLVAQQPYKWGWKQIFPKRLEITIVWLTIRALWAALSWRTQLNCTWIPKPQSGYNKYHYFKPLSFGLIHCIAAHMVCVVCSVFFFHLTLCLKSIRIWHI